MSQTVAPTNDAAEDRTSPAGSSPEPEGSPAQKAVIVGQGYVGLPLAQAAVAAGVDVVGFEISAELAQRLNAGQSHVDDLSNADIAAMLRQGYRASADPQVIADADIVVVCVPTPLSDEGGPDLRAVEGSSATIAEHLTPGTTVILESTTYPGTTDDIVRPILERSGLRHGTDFLLAYSPERVDPGSAHYGIVNTPKLVGGATPEASEAAASFYETFVDTVVPMSGTKEAETAKLLENTYRHVNIALVNEMARFCHDLDIDIWEVIRGAATKPFGFQKFTPGPGVGGHCIPIDPNYLGYQVKKQLGYPFRFVELAQEINNSMPQYVTSRIGDLLNDDAKPLNGARVLLLGITYKPNVADQRESPALPVARMLQEKKADLHFHDPHVQQWRLDDRTLSRVPDLDESLREADIVVLLQAHAGYDVDSIAAQSRTFFDTRGLASHAENVHTL
ncbi:MAG TPA: nucleotide sugar dehydrogenase [Candidatus Nesterenkonia stercoripullorum]|uniref:Nucleotide sugar dehydrogenase n=1 Tax=Candidatus Nesterenkonia stercoripullorum TaxID=2838701 RepID=A0A9D1USG8_9MICC|nr:nucleotide sugar dehydrogenase [Candidatus Nesterenkonia stercoripullorum]